jgi:trimeric autotransporter adhesin
MTRHWQSLKGRSLWVIFGAVAILTVIPISAAVAAPQDSSATGQAVAPAAQAASGVPRLFSFSGVVKDASGNLKTGLVTLTFSIYADFEGGTPLWSETQGVQLDGTGHYTVLVGATSPSGLPLDLFTTGTARWLGVQSGVTGVGEQPRVLLVGMPYALKAADADTLGGQPASAYVLAPTQNASGGSVGASGTSAAGGTTVVVTQPARASVPEVASGFSSAPAAVTPCTAVKSGGSATTGQMAMFTAACNIDPSLITQTSGNVGVRGPLQLPPIGTATATTAFNSQPFDALASAFNSSTHKAVSQDFRWQAEPVGNNTASPLGKLNLLFASGTGTPTETGLSISNKGLITFASGQALPTVTGNETVTGNLSAQQLISSVTTGTPPLSVKSTTLVPNLNAGLLGGLPAGSFATLGANLFTANQTIAGNGTNILIGNVGCGSPTAGIGIGSVNCNTFGLGFDGAQNSTFINRPMGGRIIFREGNSTSQMTINSGGSVGIGTEVPVSATLEVDAPSDSAQTAGRFVGSLSSGFSSAAPGVSAQGGNTLISFGGNGGDFFGGNSNAGTAGDGVSAVSGIGPTPGFAGNFSGDLNVTGTIFAGVKDFKIDHPLVPANKYLYHSSVESSEMMNLYTGNAILGADGQAVVDLPSWFQAENADFRYSLTAIGAPAPNLHIAQEIADNHFRIAGGGPGMKVSWQVTGVRQDAFAKAHPLEVEVDKPGSERGFYIHPELYGAPEEKGMEWARNPQLMKQRKEMREKQQANLAGSAKP